MHKQSQIKKKKIFAYIFYPIFDLLCVAGISLFTLLGLKASGTNFTSLQIKGASVYVIILTFAIILINFSVGIYKSLTENFGIVESLKLIIFVFVIVIIIYLLSFAIPDKYLFHISPFVYIIDAILLPFLLCAGRYIFRVKKCLDGWLSSRSNKKKRTLVIGAGDACKIVLDDARTNRSSHNKIVVIMDDDPNKIGSTFSNIPIRGPLTQMASVIDTFHIEEVIIAIASLSAQRLREILELLEPCNVTVRRLPLLTEFSGVNEKKILDIDIMELLGRQPVRLDTKLIHDNLKDKIILITGAGGSIGSELARQIYSYRPKLLILFDIYEHGVYDLQQELKSRIKDGDAGVPFNVLIGSVYDRFRVDWLFRTFHPDYVYHAAAYKHVPLMEDSPAEAIRTNVIGTYNVARAANEYGCHKMTLVSTDKAVRPTSVMGATKRFAELIIQHFSALSTFTHYSAVRFGNVLGSNGSVVPLFLKQIERGGPLTVTHREIIRYFMSIPEAVGLILQSSIYADRGEIFILDMGKQMKIVTLAEKMIRQAGLVPYKDIDIVFTGLRPGEKLYEETLIDVSKHKKTANPKIFVEDAGHFEHVEQDVSKIAAVFNMDQNSDITSLLKTIIKIYKSEEIKCNTPH